jgi:hypothetical protein
MLKKNNVRPSHQNVNFPLQRKIVSEEFLPMPQGTPIHPSLVQAIQYID